MDRPVSNIIRRCYSGVIEFSTDFMDILQIFVAYGCIIISDGYVHKHTYIL